MFERFKAWLVKQLSTPEKIAAPAHSTGATGPIDHENVQNVVPYDENLLERSRTQWQFGDWESLAKLERDTLQHHPDRAKLALLAAAGHLQHGDSQAARQFTRLAQDWGCSKKLISQILISGVHNSLGRIAGVSGQSQKENQHFNQAISIGSFGGDVQLLTQARQLEQRSQLHENIKILKFNTSDKPKELTYSNFVNYNIDTKYQARNTYFHYDDMSAQDEWQLEVYLHAYSIMKKYRLESVADIGCGSAYKLITYLGDYETIGYELPANVDLLRKKYPERHWEISDLSSIEQIDADVIICSDVIEHLVNPDELLQFLAKQRARFIIISTPDRDLVYESGDPCLLGPPRNQAHQREWNFKEFSNYIGNKFYVKEHVITNTKQATQMIICEKAS